MNEVYVYKLRNKKTGQYGDGHSYNWYDDFIGTTNFKGVGPIKAILTKAEKNIKWYENPKHGYVGNQYYTKHIQSIRDFINDAEIVRCRISLELVDEDNKLLPDPVEEIYKL